VRWPVLCWPVLCWPVLGWPVLGWPVLGSLFLGLLFLGWPADGNIGAARPGILPRVTPSTVPPGTARQQCARHRT
jgi:hypothetical protein